MAIDVQARQFSGPIPGENFTSDTKNYPWHRPPEYTDMDSAIEASFKKLTEDDNSVGVLTMLEYGISVAEVTDMFVTAGIGAGKWTPDFAILLAGPVAHIIYLMAKGYGIDCDMGLEPQNKPLTKPFFDGQKRIDEKRAAGLLEDVNLNASPENVEEGVTDAMGGENTMGGFMGMSGGSAEPTGNVEEEPAIDQMQEGMF